MVRGRLVFSLALMLLAGASRAQEPPAAPGRITSVASKTWIWPERKTGGRFLGYVRIGDSVRLRQPELAAGEGCRGGFFAIEPRGWVCNDRTVTRGEGDAFLSANAHTLARDGAYPYRYALSNGAPMYARVPTPAEQRRKESYQYAPPGEWLPFGPFQRGHEALAIDAPIAPADAMPSFLEGGGGARGKPLELLVRSIPHGSMLSFTRAFDFGGRTFLLSTDLTIVPAERVREFRPSAFHGVDLSGVELPIAFFRREPRKKYLRLDAGVAPSGETWPARSWVGLTGAEIEHDGRRYLATRDGAFALAEDATVVRARDSRPFGVPAGHKWMIVSITEGTLVAYEDLRPVYATLVSPGQGGVPRPGGDLVKDSTTPLGRFPITFKDRATTMSPDSGEERSFWIADVPFTQYFAAPFALHAAYWHENFGEPMSAGCVNASPLDAQWLFAWSDPPVPDGWQGATGAGAPENGAFTHVVITR